MNDRYLFKAKRKNWQELPKDEQWVQGYYYQIWENGYILWGMTNDVPNMIEIDVSTLCQCTSLKDKNGNLIWENDICNYYNSEDKDGIGIIKNDYVLWIDGTISMRHKMTPLFYLQCKDEWKVIGNIFDNPELMESEEK
nr:MAG TPA: YopX protein [Bacteriophage sp.]